MSGLRMEMLALGLVEWQGSKPAYHDRYWLF